MSKKMVYLESPSTDAAFNLALEQYVFDEMDRDCEYFMLWQNANAVIIGKNQNTLEEIDQSYVEEHGIQVIRRLTGGGAVYHDLGNLNFTFIVDGGEPSRMDLHMFCYPVARALKKLGVEAQVGGRNDITIDGKKFSGNSQYIKGGRILHHGTLMFDSDLTVLSRCLKVSADKIASKGVKSVRSRVTNIRDYLEQDISLAQFRDFLVEAMGEERPMERHIFTPEELGRADEIRRERYGRWEWNYGASPRFTIRKKRRVEGCGQIEAFIEVRKGRIEAISFYGDYFGGRDTAELAERLVGCPLEGSALRQILAGIPVEEYFHGLTGEELFRILH